MTGNKAAQDCATLQDLVEGQPCDVQRRTAAIIDGVGWHQAQLAQEAQQGVMRIMMHTAQEFTKVQGYLTGSAQKSGKGNDPHGVVEGPDGSRVLSCCRH